MLQQNVTAATVSTTTETATESAPPPLPPSASGYSLTYTHSTENGTVITANNGTDSGVAKSRKKGDLEEPVEELPSLPDPPYHAEEAENATTRDLISQSLLISHELCNTRWYSGSISAECSQIACSPPPATQLNELFDQRIVIRHFCN